MKRATQSSSANTRRVYSTIIKLLYMCAIRNWLLVWRKIVWLTTPPKFVWSGVEPDLCLCINHAVLILLYRFLPWMPWWTVIQRTGPQTLATHNTINIHSCAHKYSSGRFGAVKIVNGIKGGSSNIYIPYKWHSKSSVPVALCINFLFILSGSDKVSYKILKLVFHHWSYNQ